MFGLSEFISTILVSIFSLIITSIIILPNFFKLKRKIWLGLKITLLVILIALVIVFSDATSDSYYFLGSFIGAGFLVKGILESNGMSLILFLCSFLSFSLIFLSIGQIALFILCLCYSYILMIGFTAFFLFKDKTVSKELIISRKTQAISFIVLLAIPVTSMYILLILSQNQIIWLEPISLLDLFAQNYEALAILVVFLIFLIILVFIFVIDLKSKNKQRGDEPWFT